MASSAELLENFVRCRKALILIGEIIIIEVALIEQHTVKLDSDFTTCLKARRQLCCVHCDIGLVTCDLYHQLIVCSIWKEPKLVRYFSAPELYTDKHAVTIFGHCLWMLYG